MFEIKFSAICAGRHGVLEVLVSGGLPTTFGVPAGDALRGVNPIGGAGRSIHFWFPADLGQAGGRVF
jgi:hypothetical protein